MMNFYPFFGSPFYRRFSRYYSNNNSVYNARCETSHNLGYNTTHNPVHNTKYNSTYRSNCNLHNCNNIPNKNAETHCFPSNLHLRNQEKFDNSNFSNFSFKNCEKSRNDNLKNFIKSKNDNFKSTENTCYSKDNDLPYIDSCSEDNYSFNEYFEIFGLKLHFDDLLIICILFFLYQEDVKDTYLYISLILLLLS